MSDIASAFLNALGMGKKKPQQPVLTAAEEAAPWDVPQSGGAMPQGGSAEVPTPPGSDPPGRLEDIDALLQAIKKQKQRAAVLGGSPVPQ